MQADIITCRVPMCAGGRAANTAQKSNQMMKTTLSLTSDRCGAEHPVLRRIRLPSTVAETGEMPYGTTNIF